MYVLSDECGMENLDSCREERLSCRRELHIIDFIWLEKQTLRKRKCDYSAADGGATCFYFHRSTM